MTGRLEGKVAFITGAARGQGRAHADWMATEGAHIIAVDIAGKLPDCVPYDSATPEHLAETVRLVEATGRRILATVADTRDSAASPSAVGAGRRRIRAPRRHRRQRGHHAAAGLEPDHPGVVPRRRWTSTTGTWNAVMAGAQKIIDGGRGGSIILISSAAGSRCSRS